MGAEGFYPEEAPVHDVFVAGFWMEATTVTNGDFARFVEATGHVTTAERAPDPAMYPGADPELLVPGSLQFDPPDHPVRLDDWSQWWRYLPGASWRTPAGPGSDLVGLDQHPVVHVTYEDAEAYAEWVGGSLPTEAEWERAARGGIDGARFPWGDDEQPGGQRLANSWQGRFPYENTVEDGFAGTAPVGSFPANGFGLFDMVGNVWEWTSDWYVARRTVTEGTGASCCSPGQLRRPDREDSFDPAMPEMPIPRKVIKGGSHLCAPSYCFRYRPAARSPETIETSTCHLGIRVVIRPDNLAG